MTVCRQDWNSANLALRWIFILLSAASPSRLGRSQNRHNLARLCGEDATTGVYRLPRFDAQLKPVLSLGFMFFEQYQIVI